VSSSVPAPIAVARSAWLPAGSGGALFVVAAFTGSVWPQLLGCVVFGFLVTSFLAIARPLRIDVAIELPDRLVAGKPFETAISLHNASARAVRALVVRHSWPTSRTLVAAHATFVDRIDAHHDLVIATTRTPAARGVLLASEVRIEATAPFGFFSRTMVVSVDRELVVLPVLASPESISSAAGGDGATMRARGTEAGGVREWRSGDQVKSVQWRSTARTGRLTVVERDHVSAGPLVLLIAGRIGDPALEHAISKAATVSSMALRRGAAVLIAAEDGRCVRARTEGSLVELLARTETREPLDDAALSRAMRFAADGGSVLVVAGRTVLSAWTPAVLRAATMAGATVVDTADREATFTPARVRA
jgi:uncharacterized protein (DUF58 family)